MKVNVLVYDQNKPLEGHTWGHQLPKFTYFQESCLFDFWDNVCAKCNEYCIDSDCHGRTVRVRGQFIREQGDELGGIPSGGNRPFVQRHEMAVCHAENFDKLVEFVKAEYQRLLLDILPKPEKKAAPEADVKAS